MKTLTLLEKLKKQKSKINIKLELKKAKKNYVEKNQLRCN